MDKPTLSKMILEEVKVARPLLLFRVFRHDPELKRALGIKKLRKRMFYDLADKSFIIRGSGDLVVYDEESAKLLLSRIKKKIRYGKEIPV